jgi:hypothetical protein
MGCAPAGSGGSLTASLSGTAVNALAIGSGGSEYIPGTYPLAFSGGGGTGADATYTVNLSGVIASTTLIAGGVGYTSPPTVAIPTGAGATAVALLNQGGVSGVAVVSGGTGLTGTPTLTFVGGGGSGAAATATVGPDGSIASVLVTAAGVNYTSPPAVEVETSLNNAAYAVLDLMPFGISGTSIETFLSRVWISDPFQIGTQQNGGLMSVSATDSLVDFSTGDGGVLFVNTDRFLRERFVALRQSNGYLYTMGDSSVSVVNNVQTTTASGSTEATTTFNYQNASSQIGTPWRDTVADYGNQGQGILFANPNGAQGLYGGSVRKVSAKMDDVFAKAIFPPNSSALTPSGAVANIYTIPIYLLLMTVLDPLLGTNRNVMVAWDEKEWYIASQGASLTFIGTQVENSLQTAWGTDGTSLYPLFYAPSSTLLKKFATKLYGGEREYLVYQPLSVNLRLTDNTAAQSGVAGSIFMEAAQVAVQAGMAPFVVIPPVLYQNPVQPSATMVNSPNATWNAIAASLSGTALGLTFESTSPDFVVSGISIGYNISTSTFD